MLTWTPFPGKILLILSFWFLSDAVAYESSAKCSFVLTQAAQTHYSNAQST